MLTSRYIFLSKPVVVLAVQKIVAGMVAVNLRAKGYVLDTHYEKAFETDVTLRVLGAFREHGIEAPVAYGKFAETEQVAAAASGANREDWL